MYLCFLIFKAVAADCKRVTVLKYFLEALCGQEEPLLAFKGGKYVSIASLAISRQSEEDKSQSQTKEPCQVRKRSSAIMVRAFSPVKGRSPCLSPVKLTLSYLWVWYCPQTLLIRSLTLTPPTSTDGLNRKCFVVCALLWCVHNHQ